MTDTKLTMGKICSLAKRELLRQREIEASRPDSRSKTVRLYRLDKQIDELHGMVIQWEKSEKRDGK